MPYSIRKVNKKPCYRVYNTKTKKVFSKCSSKANVVRQLKLLRAIQNNKSFIPNGRTRRRR
jgi:hypothetical protein